MDQYLKRDFLSAEDLVRLCRWSEKKGTRWFQQSAVTWKLMEKFEYTPDAKYLAVQHCVVVGHVYY